eukprot:scaffold222663_cov41-Attheya_sp.AAC.1
MAFRLRVSSSDGTIERIGVTLGVVVGVKGAMVGLLLLLIIVCVLDVPGTGQKHKPEAEKCLVGQEL